jgi:hypothetical protein
MEKISLTGWQSRWFILEGGILSYYKSYDEVSQGCKGSLNISACEIVVNSADNTRLDLIISGGEQVQTLKKLTLAVSGKIYVHVHLHLLVFAT